MDKVIRCRVLRGSIEAKGVGLVDLKHRMKRGEAVMSEASKSKAL
jgi:hypothetical protein